MLPLFHKALDNLLFHWAWISRNCIVFRAGVYYVCSFVFSANPVGPSESLQAARSLPVSLGF